MDRGRCFTYRVVQRLSLAFAAKTDLLIADVVDEVTLRGDELIDSVPQWYDHADSGVVDLLLEGSDLAVEQCFISPEYKNRYRAF